jgi:hypothetical protein
VTPVGEVAEFLAGELAVGRQLADLRDQVDDRPAGYGLTEVDAVEALEVG